VRGRLCRCPDPAAALIKDTTVAQQPIPLRDRALIDHRTVVLHNRELPSKYLVGHPNAEIETIELDLREVISDRLDNDPQRLPGHISPRARERAAAVAKREPARAVSADGLDLMRLLEFLDLRELQDVISSKLTWPVFADVFVSKENLAVRFSQLADLRNAIRHSRTVSEITRKDGETAALWFTQPLDAAASTPAQAPPSESWRSDAAVSG
jgi:hypothetical protein